MNRDGLVADDSPIAAVGLELGGVGREAGKERLENRDNIDLRYG